MKRGRPNRVRRGPLTTVAPDPDYERKAANRQRKVAPVLRALDEADPLVRRLVHYFGSQKVDQALQYCNPEDVAARLRDEPGFAKFLEAYAPPEKPAPRPDPAMAWRAFQQSGGEKR